MRTVDELQRHLRYEDVVRGVGMIFGDRMRHMDYGVKIGLDPNIDNSATWFDHKFPVGAMFHDPFDIHIGTQSLCGRMDASGSVCDEDAVRVFMHTYHECFHAWALGIGYMRSPGTALPQVKHMARDRALCLCFDSYGPSMYMLDTEELEADLASVRGVRSFFSAMCEQDPRYRDINLDGIVSGIASDRHGISWPDVKTCKTAADTEAAYARAAAVAPFRKRFDRAYLAGHCGKDRRMQVLLRDDDFVLSVVNAGSGSEQTDMLCRYAGRLYPGCFRSLPCIKNEYMSDNVMCHGESALSKLLRAVPRYDDVPQDMSQDYFPDM